MKPKHALALGALAGVIAAAPLTAVQEPAPPRTTEQQKVKDRVDALESRQKTDEEKAERAALEKDRIDKIQQHYEDYQKVQTTEMRALEAVAAIFALFIGFAALFGFSVFSQRIQYAVSQATNQLERKFDEKIVAELKALKDSNAAQLKQLEDDLNCRTYYNLYFAQGQAAGVDGRNQGALDSFRRALRTYKSGKTRGLFAIGSGERVVRNIFVVIEKLHKDKFTHEAKKELADELYDDLKDELALVALEVDGLVPLVRERIAAQPAHEETSPTIAADTTAHSRGPLKVFRNGEPMGEIVPSDTFRCGGQIPSTPPLELLCKRCAQGRGYTW